MTITAQLMRDSGSVSTDSSNQATATERYLIQDDTGERLTFSRIRDLGIIPEFGTRYDGTSALCSAYDFEINPANMSIGYLTVKYETRNYQSSSSSSGRTNPILQPATVWYGIKTRNEVAEVAYDVNDDRDNPTLRIENTAGDQFDRGLAIEKSDLVVFVEKNYRDFDPGDIEKYQGTVNLGNVTIGGVKFSDEQALMQKISHRLMFDDDGVQYDRMHFEIVKRDEGWRRKIVSNGFYHLSGGDRHRFIRSDVETKPVDVTDEQWDKMSKMRCTEPHPLDVNGYNAIASGQPAAVLEFLMNFKIEWSKLDLPQRKDGSK